MIVKKLVLFFLLLYNFQYGHTQPVNADISNGIAFDGEPYLAINPVNTRNLVAAWMSLKLSGSQLLIAIKTRASFDGGTTWSIANTLPHFGTGYGSADVSMAFDKTGLLYICYIDFRQSPDSGGIYVARSVNGGLNWDIPTQAFNIYDVPGKDPIDRPWLVVDNSGGPNTGTVYVTSKPAYFIPPPNRNYFKASADSGHTWTAIANVDGGNYLVGGLIAQPMAAPAITTNGNFCAIYPSYVSSQNVLPAYYLATSADRGQTFSYSTVIAAAAIPEDTNLKGGYHLASSPVDSDKMVFLVTDNLYGDADIMALHSNNGGETWSSRIRVNDDSIGNGKDQDMVWASYNTNGNLAVTWRDRRNDTTEGFWNAGYDFYYALSNDNGQTFSANQKLSSQFISFDSILTAKGNDFMTCAYLDDTLYIVWGDTRTGRMNIFFAKTIASSNINTGYIMLEGDKPAWKVFPNPAAGDFNISVGRELIGKQISVYDEQGRKLSGTKVSSTNFMLKDQNYPAGIYFIEIDGGVQRIVKQ